MAPSQLDLDTADGPMPTYEARPDGDAKGGIVVIQEAFGVTRHIEEIADRLAAAGWHAVAPALFHRDGSPVLGYDDFAAVMPLMGGLSQAGIGVDVTAALGHLEGAGWPPARQGIVGFCMGGSVAFHAAVDYPLGAAVTFYGGGIAEGRFGYPPQVERAGQLQTPWLGLYGDLDKGIPPEQVEALRAGAAAAAVPTEVVRYADADHGFNCTDRPAVYNAAASADAWGRALAWFEAHLAAG
jgi:carboxymethylenebutenolidase